MREPCALYSDNLYAICVTRTTPLRFLSPSSACINNIARAPPLPLYSANSSRTKQPCI
jgi:hypothetical protein